VNHLFWKALRSGSNRERKEDDEDAARLDHLLFRESCDDALWRRWGGRGRRRIVRRTHPSCCVPPPPPPPPPSPPSAGVFLWALVSFGFFCAFFMKFIVENPIE
jgi:hypothetical protein